MTEAGQFIGFSEHGGFVLDPKSGKVDWLREENGNYVSKGTYYTTGKKSAKVTELPIGMWTQSYKDFLDANVKDRTSERSKKAFLQSTPKCGMNL